MLGMFDIAADGQGQQAAGDLLPALLKSVSPELGSETGEVTRCRSGRRVRKFPEQHHASDCPLQSLPWLAPILGKQAKLPEGQSHAGFVV